MQKKKKWLMKYATFALLVTITLLTSCATNTQDGSNSARLYSAEYLYFQKDQQIQTSKGIYVFQTDSSYVAKWKYQEVETKLLAAEAALRKIEAEKDLAR